MLKYFSLISILLLSVCAYAQADSINILKVGDKAPEFHTNSHKNTTVDLAEMLKKGKVVIVFYRGAWCPYCNKHMSHLQDSLSLILDKGASVIAISPEVESSIDKTISKTKASFEIVHDSAYAIMKKYGVAFKLSESTVKKYKLFGIDLEEANGNKDNILPVPATIIINQDGTISYIHFDENYKNRLPVKQIINHL
ncbi:MAG: AhpC/TSA family protein [Nitrosopumilus sp.]|nr:AhpC/TSA family protein [Nitrosopumilus sp.]